jgi:capsular exopolysaccharide synthesis family protein
MNDSPAPKPAGPGYPPSYPGGYPEPVSAGDLARDLQTYWYLFLEKLWLIGAIVFAGMALTVAYIVMSHKMYKATATVQVQSQDQSAVKLDAYRDNQTGLEQMTTIVGKFQSRPLFALVLFQAGLISSNAATALSLDPTVVSLDLLNSPSNTTASAAPSAAGYPGTNAAVAASILPKLAGSALLTDVTKAEMGLMNSFSQRAKATLRRNTRLIDVTVTDPDPDLAARLANLMVENYLKQDFSIKSTTSRSQSAFFKVEFDRLARKLQDSEQALQDYAELVGTVELANLAGAQSDQFQEYQHQMTLTQADVIRLKSAYDQSLKMGTNVNELLAYTAIASDPQVQSCQTAIAQKEADFLLIKQQFREKNPKYILAVNTLDGLKAQLVEKVLAIRHQIQESFRLPYENALVTQAGLVKQLAKVQTENLDLSQKGIHYNLLARQVASDQAMFVAVSQRLNDLSVNSQLAPVNISVVQPAFPPDAPSSPKVKLLLFLGFFGSLALGLGLVLMQEQFNTTLRTVDDTEQFLQLPVLAAIPRLKIDEQDYHSRLVVASQGAQSAEVELFRTLRASIAMLGKEQERRSFLFTSSFPQEGKSFTSCNFAASLAQQGLRTVVFDLDLRRPRLEEFLTGETKHIAGLTEVLENKLKLAEVIQTHPQVPNMFWVAAGAIISNPSELLSQGLFKKVFEQAMKDYDRVIIDTSPLHPVKDALLVANEVSTVIVLVDGSQTPRKPVAKTIQWLRSVNAPVAGVVLNLLPRRRKGQGYYYYGYYGYSYGNYSHNGKETSSKTERRRHHVKSEVETRDRN